jgi:hypothetical protein
MFPRIPPTCYELVVGVMCHYAGFLKLNVDALGRQIILVPLERVNARKVISTVVT